MNEEEFIQFLQSTDNAKLIYDLPSLQVQAWQRILSGVISDELREYAKEKGMRFAPLLNNEMENVAGFMRGIFFALGFYNTEWQNKLCITFYLHSDIPFLTFSDVYDMAFADCLPDFKIDYGIATHSPRIEVSEELRFKVRTALETHIAPSETEHIASWWIWGNEGCMLPLYKDDHADFVDFIKNTVDQLAPVLNELASND